MFNASVYRERRQVLRRQMGSGLLLFPGNGESPMNYPANTYPFRQDSSFLYYFGVDKPGFVGLIDVDEDCDYLYGNDFDIDDIIWMGPQPSVRELADVVGINSTGDNSQLAERLAAAVNAGRRIHFLSPYRMEEQVRIAEWLGLDVAAVNRHASRAMIRAVVTQRSTKSEAEIREIEKALEISSRIYETVMDLARPGVNEGEVAGALLGVVGRANSHISFPTILSVHGETLHNHFHGNEMREDDLLVVDSGAESPEHYASDITRTFPVGGRFTPVQRQVYEIVLRAQEAAIQAMRPGTRFLDCHMMAAREIATGLKEIGLMKGDVDEAVQAGAHALFFPHGLGHMMGLDVHDMENLGENLVGYDETISRSRQFGLSALRMARELFPGFVVTVEPGIYFIPALIDQWRREGAHSDFIDYDALETFRDFGGIRIEDDVLVTAEGHRVLGPKIPKTVADIESGMKG
ncbi:MAG TPA: aminopeptidase P family protein [Candidatus Aminicenantes bacterium]|nr:aminopeptidase P family protein [Candidatus Aminicenantes bacterium]